MIGLKNILIVVVLCILGCQPDISTIAAKANITLKTTETEHFIIMAQESTEVGTRLESEYKRFYTKFAIFKPSRPAQKLEWVSLGSYEALAIYVRMADGVDIPWMEAYYSSLTNRVATKNLYDKTVTHELAHQLSFNSGIQDRNAVYPIWFTEGLSTNFEQMDSYKIRWEEIKANGDAIPMDKFMAMTMISLSRLSDVIDVYAQCWYLFDHLMRTNPNGLREYIIEINNMPFRTPDALKRTFVKHFGNLEGR